MTWDQLSAWLCTFVPWAHRIAVSKQQPLCNHYPCLVSGFFQSTSKLFLSERASWVQLKEFARKNAANALSVANMVMGMASILSSLNGWGAFKLKLKQNWYWAMLYNTIISTNVYIDYRPLFTEHYII